MNNYRTLFYIGKSLINLLWNNFDKEIRPDIIASDQDIVLSSPEEIADGRKLSIFLYQATEDAFQKNQPSKPGVNSVDGSPLNLNLFYMITPNTKDGEKDQILLGNVAQIFNDNPVLKSHLLQGPLADDRRDLHIVFNPLSLDDINKIWTVVSKSRPYRFSLYYEVTPVRIDSTRLQPVSRVGGKDTNFKGRTQ